MATTSPRRSRSPARLLTAALALAGVAGAQTDWVRVKLVRGAHQSACPIAYDSARDRAVLVVPRTEGTVETWEWGGAVWALRAPQTRPSARANFAVVYDAARRRVVLFGGGGTSGVLADTW